MSWQPDRDRPVVAPALFIWLKPDGSPPPGPFVRPRRRAVHVLFGDGSWRPCEVLAWFADRSPTGESPVWYVRLKLLVDGRGQVSEGWWAYRAESFRPR